MAFECPGSCWHPHVHLGEEIVFTISGKAILEIDGKDWVLEPNTSFLIPVDVPHGARGG